MRLIEVFGEPPRGVTLEAGDCQTRLPRLPILALLVLMNLVFLGCGGPSQWGQEVWKEDKGRGHPLLKDGVKIVTRRLEPYRPAPIERVIREKGRYHSINEVDDLRPYLREIRSSADALIYSKLLREFLSPVLSPDIRLGEILYLDTDPDHSTRKGGMGSYTPFDVQRWGVPPEPKVEEEKDDFRVERIVVLPPERPDEDRPEDGWRVVLMEERISRDGAYSSRTLRTLDPKGSRYHAWLM